MVYVLNIDGQPLMPTMRHGNVRMLLKSGKAKVIRRCPFTIQLLYKSTNYTQPVTLGVDSGSKTVGISATTEQKVLYEAEVTLRDDIVKLLADRRELRRSRRHRKTRYREKRFDNRRRPTGWLPPSVEHRINTHLTVIRRVHEILPVTNIIVEVASFDIQKIKNPNISGTEYQQGEQLGFWNVREYVLARDEHTCQCCKGRSGDKVLNVHHIESRKTGGNAPNNLVTLCETCHKGYHNGTIKLPKNIQRDEDFNGETLMNIMRKRLHDRLKAEYTNVELTYGYITKNARIAHNLPKTHYIDARCISGHPDALSSGEVYYQKKMRCHNKQIHKVKIIKGGKRKQNQSPYLVKGFRLFDRVQYKGQECFVFGRRTSGYFDVRTLDGTKISPCASYKKLKLLEKRKTFLTERRMVVQPIC